MRGRRGVSLREQLNIRHRSNHTWIKRVSLPSLTPQLVFLISSFLSWFHLKMRFPRKTPSASVPRHFCVLLRFGGPRRDDDASDTCGACNVLNQTRGQTSQSVVCVSQRREERVRETVGTPFPGRERENAFGRVLFCIEALPKTHFQTKDSCERRKIDDDDDDIIIAKEKKHHHHQRRTIACFTGPNDPVLMNFARYHSIIIFNSRRRRRRGEEEEES